MIGKSPARSPAFSPGASPNAHPGEGAVIELVTNGSFSSGDGWTLGVGWTISGGRALSDGTGGQLDLIARPLDLPITAPRTIRWSVSLGWNGETPAASTGSLIVIADDDIGTNAETVVDLAGQPSGTYSGTYTIGVDHGATPYVGFGYRTIQCYIDNLSITVQG